MFSGNLVEIEIIVKWNWYTFLFYKNQKYTCILSYTDFKNLFVSSALAQKDISIGACWWGHKHSSDIQAALNRRRARFGHLLHFLKLLIRKVQIGQWLSFTCF